MNAVRGSHLPAVEPSHQKVTFSQRAHVGTTSGSGSNNSVRHVGWLNPAYNMLRQD